MIGTSCVLFFPGSRPELLTKVVASGVRLACVDLEDAVAPDAKNEARTFVLELIAHHAGPPSLAVRINHPSTEAGREDIAALVSSGHFPAPLTVLAPKVDSRAEVDSLHERLSGCAVEVSIIPVIETAVGLSRVEDIAQADGVSALLVGGLDLSVDLHCALDWEALLYARSRCVHAARIAGVDVIDTPFFDVRDAEGLRHEAERSRRLGFDGKAAIHPSQVPAIHEAFVPDGAAVERAQRVIAASERERGGAVLVDGIMVDRPAVEAARRIVSRSPTEEA